MQEKFNPFVFLKKLEGMILVHAVVEKNIKTVMADKYITFKVLIVNPRTNLEGLVSGINNKLSTL
jgi:hypothetical protein